MDRRTVEKIAVRKNGFNFDVLPENFDANIALEGRLSTRDKMNTV